LYTMHHHMWITQVPPVTFFVVMDRRTPSGWWCLIPRGKLRCCYCWWCSNYGRVGYCLERMMVGLSGWIHTVTMKFV
jgi:hypothetical protein